MSSLSIAHNNQELVSKLIASQKKRTQKSAILVITNKGIGSISAITASAFANDMSSIEVPASQLHEPEKQQVLKDMQFMGLMVIISGIGNATIEARAILNELIVNIYAGYPTWLNPESQLVLVDYVEDRNSYGERALEPAAVDRTTTVQLFGW